MLETGERSIYLEELKPPEGFHFDSAIATTFTLDLMTLLMAPLSLSLLESENTDEALKNPIVLLEALRRTANNLTIFCQRGYISVPKKDSLLYSYLEGSVIPVNPVLGHGIFHPKLWVLRFRNEQETFYRVLNLSRNLTFDQSWDIVLCLEGYYNERKNGFTKNMPLRDFVRSLSDMAVSPLSNERREQLLAIAYEVYRVEFEAPEGFEEIQAFCPSGINGYRNQRFPQDIRRCLMISPFLSDNGIDVLLRNGENNVLISREESLDNLSDNIYQQLIEKANLYYMDNAVEYTDEGTEEDKALVDNGLVHSRGLHAKIFVMDNGWYSTFMTGSANATNSGLHGENVEFTVQLRGKRSRVGIDAFLGEGNKNRSSIMNLLHEYTRYEQDPQRNDEAMELEQLLKRTRLAFTESSMFGQVKKDSGNTYTMELHFAQKEQVTHSEMLVYCYPITLSRDCAKQVKWSDHSSVLFPSLSLNALTSFIAIEISIKKGTHERIVSFVLNIPIEGIPVDERNNSILTSILHDKGRFFRYLLLILMDHPNAYILEEILSGTIKSDDIPECSNPYYSHGFPLLEELLKAFSREPEKIERISRLVNNIKETEKADEILPLLFEQTWDVLIEAFNQRNTL